MYGYEPPDQGREGSWREVLLVLRVVFATIAPILGVLVGVIFLLSLTVYLLIRMPPLALIPIAVIAAIVFVLVRRDRRRHEEERRRIFGPR